MAKNDKIQRLHDAGVLDKDGVRSVDVDDLSDEETELLIRVRNKTPSRRSRSMTAWFL
jgi:hypothetical protein